MKKMLVVFLALALLVVGCGPQQPAAQQTTAAGAVEQQTENIDSDQPVVARTAIGSELDSLDPWISAASDTEAVMGNVFEGLVWYDENGNLIPALAKSWEISEDGLTYTFHLQEGVTFHNGAAFSADDVVYSIEKLSGLNGEEPLSSRFAKVETVQAVDELTVAIKLAERNAAFLSSCIAEILPKDYADQATNPVGTGPFVFKSYEPGQKVVLEKNVAYWNDAAMAHIDVAEFYIITDPTAVVNGLRSGQLDFAEIDPKNVKLVENEFEILASPQNMVQLMSMNNKRAPFDDVKVRQAVNYAVNKEQLIAAVANGYGTELVSNMSPIMAQYHEAGATAYAQDLEKAKALMAEAGYADGFKTSVTVPSNYKFHVDTAQVVANQLQQIGIEVEIEQVEWGVWLDEVYKRFNYDMTIIGLSGKLDPHQILVRYKSDYKRNFICYQNEAYDALIDQALLETEPVERAKLYRECQMLLADDAAAVYIMDPNLVVAMRKGISGFKFFPLRFIDMSSIKYN